MLIRAEMWDKMQYLFRNYYDRMVHAALYYDNLVDVAVIKNLLLVFTEKTPILHSSYHNNPIKPYWKVEKYTIDDILTVKDSEDLEKDVNDFLTNCIPAQGNVQYKVAIFNKGNKSTLCMLVNHMCFDGGDFKYFLATLSDNYNNIIDGSKKVVIKSGSRSHEEVYTKFNEEDKKIAKGLFKNISAVKDMHKFPLTEPNALDKSRIIIRKLDNKRFNEIKKIGKLQGATINDLMLAFYIRALYQIGNYDPNKPLTVPCMVDLRRHIAEGGKKSGLANHTGFMPCTVNGLGDTINDTLIEVLRSVKRSKRDRFMGLYSLPLLRLAYTVFPHCISEFAIKLGYSNPLLGMSNIGLIEADKLRFGNANLVDALMTGAVKYKPYMQLALTTLNDTVTMTVAIRGNDEDERTVNKFFDYLIKNADDYIELNTKNN